MSEQPWEDDDMSEDVDASEGALEAAPEPNLPADIAVPLTTDQARVLTDTIRSTSEVLYVLLARAHAGKAYEALGYSSFADYVRDEFDMSRSRAYQVLDQSRVIAAIESAAPDGTDLPVISEAAARDLKSIIGEVVPEIEARTAGLGPDEAGQVVEEIVEDYRDQVRERKEDAALEREEREEDEAERRGSSEPGNGPYTPPPPPDFDDDDDDFDPALIRRNVQAAYDLYSSLSALKSMPDVESVINTIPVERRVQINDSLRSSTDWLAEFQSAWFAQPWQDGDATTGDDYDEDDDEYEDDDEM